MSNAARQLISTGSPFEKAAGYSRAVAQGDWCFVSGTTGYNYSTLQMPDGVADQAENAFRTIEAALNEAGFTLRDVVQARYMISDPGFAEALFTVSGRWFGEIRPTSTLIVCGLYRPEMKVEIEVTALRSPNR